MPKITFHNDKEFGSLKITTTNKKGKFVFLRDKYSVSVFRSVKGIKIYVNDSHLFINLVQDKYGRMFYHSWFEEMNFGGGPDYLEESFSLVKDEEEADLMFQGKPSMYRRLGYIPFVCWSEEDFVLAVERAAEDIITLPQHIPSR
jgi:hypothetical protein